MPSSGQALGDAYVITSTGHLWIYTASSAGGNINGFIDSGTFVGYTGSIGIGYAGSMGRSTFTYSDTPPSSPAVGDSWMDTTIAVTFMWTDDGTSTQWVEMAASGYMGPVGYTGSRGVTGYTGSLGYTGSASTVGGYTGSAGTTIPINSQAGTYTVQLTDNGSFISTSNNVTVSSSVSFTAGQNF